MDRVVVVAVARSPPLVGTRVRTSPLFPRARSPPRPHVAAETRRASARAAFDLSASSSWRETAETRERARDAENELALQREAVRSLRTQLHVAEQQRRDDVRALEKQMAVLKTRVAEEAACMSRYRGRPCSETPFISISS